MNIKPIHKFAETLAILNRGQFLEKCDEELTNAVQKLEQLADGQSGTATITVAIKLSYNGDRVDVIPTVQTKLPAPPKFRGTPFWTYEGGLSVQHPSQFDMLAGPRDIDARARDIS